MADADDEIAVTYLSGAYDEDRSLQGAPWHPTAAERWLADLDPATYFDTDPAVQGALAHLVGEMKLTKPQRILLLGSPDDPTRAFPPVFQGRSRLYVGDAIEGVPTQADLDDLTEWKGVHLDQTRVWLDETTTDEHRRDTVRDPEQERRYAEKAAAEAAAEAMKDRVAMRGMNRADRRAYLRERKRAR